MRSGMLVFSFQIIVAIVVASTCLVSIICSLLDTADTIQVAIETFFIVEIAEKSAAILWAIISNCGDVKLEGRGKPVTMVESLLHKSESEQDKSWVAILWAPSERGGQDKSKL